jgi:hypothetical protein
VCDRVVIYYGGKIQAMGTLKELLATPDAVRITTPVLPRETMERILEIIRRDVSSDKVRVDNPTQNLESYFLDVVQKARAAQETSGAQSGARVAAYLRGEAESAPAPDKVLERLTLPETQPVVSVSAEPAAPSADEKLGGLMKSAETTPAQPKPEPAAEEKKADLSQANEKLSSLLGNKE